MSNVAGRLGAILPAITLVLISGCLFDTRDAAPPLEGGATWVVPDVPSRVFINMDNGLEDRTGVNYKRSIQDGFEFVPLTEDASNPSLAGAFDDWTADVEKQVVDRLVASASQIAVRFYDIEQIYDQSPFANFRVSYELTVTSNTAPSEVTTYKGKAQFDMQEGSKGWQLKRWEDIERVSGFATWGFLRGTLRQL